MMRMSSMYRMYSAVSALNDAAYDLSKASKNTSSKNVGNLRPTCQAGRNALQLAKVPTLAVDRVDSILGTKYDSNYCGNKLDQGTPFRPRMLRVMPYYTCMNYCLGSLLINTGVKLLNVECVNALLTLHQLYDTSNRIRSLILLLSTSTRERIYLIYHCFSRRCLAFNFVQISKVSSWG